MYKFKTRNSLQDKRCYESLWRKHIAPSTPPIPSRSINAVNRLQSSEPLSWKSIFRNLLKSTISKTLKNHTRGLR
jgi:hypothetical protein